MTERAGDEFARVYEDQIWNVYGFFAYRLGSRPDAEDLTQLTFERALRAWARFDPERASARTWLLAIAHNLLLDHYRRGRARPADPVDPVALAETARLTVEGPAPVGVAADLDAALSSLSDRDREVIALRFGGDLSGPEIAEVLDLTTPNVHQILSRALRRLRELLGEERGPDADPPAE